MKVVVLGSAAGGGFPQWNCRCKVCAKAWDRDPRASWRSQASLAVENGGAWILVDASPDLGQQLRANPFLWPKSPRHSPIAAVVLTSAEIDHVAGLLHMREGHAFDLVALPSVLDALEDNSIFGAVGYHAKRAEDGEIIQMNSGLRLKLFSVPGKAALYREGDDPRLGSVGGETAGLLIEASGGTLAYIPGCAAISPEVENQARAADVVLFDGTLFADREMIEQGIGQKTGSRMGHLPITGEGGSVDFLASLPARRKIYTHLNNTNPALIDGSPERIALEKRGIEVAYDGMEIEL